MKRWFGLSFGNSLGLKLKYLELMFKLEFIAFPKFIAVSLTSSVKGSSRSKKNVEPLPKTLCTTI